MKRITKKIAVPELLSDIVLNISYSLPGNCRNSSCSCISPLVRFTMELDGKYRSLNSNSPNIMTITVTKPPGKFFCWKEEQLENKIMKVIMKPTAKKKYDVKNSIILSVTDLEILLFVMMFP